MLDNVPVVCDIHQSTPSSFECFQSNIGNVWYFHRLCLTIMPGSVMSEEVTSDALQPEPIMRSETRPAFWAPFACTNFLWFANYAALCLGRRSICILFYHHVKSSFILCPLACSFGLSFYQTEPGQLDAASDHIPILSVDWSVQSCTQNTGVIYLKIYSLQKPLFDDLSVHEVFLSVSSTRLYALSCKQYTR